MNPLIFGAALAIAASVEAAPHCPAMLKVAFYNYGLLYTDGKGIDLDVINELKRRSHCNFVTTVLPRARIWQDLETGDLAMSVSGIQNPARDQFAWFAPYLNIKNVSIIPKELSKTLHSFEDFAKNKTLYWGVVRAFKHGDIQDQFLTTLREQNRIIEVATTEQLFDLLKAGRIQGLFSQSPIYSYYIPKLGLSQHVTMQDWATLEKPVAHGLILSKKHFSASEAEQWKNLIHAMNQDGTMQRILSQHLPSFEIRKTLYQAE
jgi:polar amino acid transport system substrate-binding protein